MVFSGKKALAARAESKIKESGFIPDGLVRGEVDWCVLKRTCSPYLEE